MDSNVELCQALSGIKKSVTFLHCRSCPGRHAIGCFECGRQSASCCSLITRSESNMLKGNIPLGACRRFNQRPEFPQMKADPDCWNIPRNVLFIYFLFGGHFHYLTQCPHQRALFRTHRAPAPAPAHTDREPRSSARCCERTIASLQLCPRA